MSWPESPIWMENDQKWIDDILTYIALETRIRWEVEHGTNSTYEAQETSAQQRHFGVDEL